MNLPTVSPLEPQSVMSAGVKPIVIEPRRSRPAAEPPRRLTGLPCWIASLVAHLVVFLACAALLGKMPRGNSLMPHVFETTLDGGGGGGWIGIGLGGPGKSETSEATVNTAAADVASSEPVLPPPPVEPPPTSSVPDAAAIAKTAQRNPTAELNVISSGDAGYRFAGRPLQGGGGQGGGRGNGSGPGTGSGSGSTSLFGIPSEGTKVVYVFDRSTSMGGVGRSPLSLAKAELLASLDQLTEADQFQVVFYNSSPTPFTVGREAPHLMRATPANKQLVRSFVGGIIADGGTEHEEALMMALRMNPDTIYFLTDADEPILGPGQLDRLSKLNRRHAVIHAIEFGQGPQLGDNFLMHIAQRNYGKYTYVDTARPELYSR